jgi:hypothetical protein
LSRVQALVLPRRRFLAADSTDFTGYQLVSCCCDQNGPSAGEAGRRIGAVKLLLLTRLSWPGALEEVDDAF